tara:strand:- start:38 stop:310 length:273 start_codon:yes stop_codon:yes gene_type:complete
MFFLLTPQKILASPLTQPFLQRKRKVKSMNASTIKHDSVRLIEPTCLKQMTWIMLMLVQVGFDLVHGIRAKHAFVLHRVKDQQFGHRFDG